MHFHSRIQVISPPHLQLEAKQVSVLPISQVTGWANSHLIGEMLGGTGECPLTTSGLETIQNIQNISKQFKTFQLPSLSKWPSGTIQIRREELLIEIQAHHIIAGRNLNQGKSDLLVPAGLPSAPSWTHWAGGSEGSQGSDYCKKSLWAFLLIVFVYVRVIRRRVHTLLRVIFTNHLLLLSRLLKNISFTRQAEYTVLLCQSVFRSHQPLSALQSICEYKNPFHLHSQSNRLKAQWEFQMWAPAETNITLYKRKGKRTLQQCHNVTLI